MQVRIPAVYRQRPFCTLFDWGPAGAEALAREADVAVVVDVLSFTTSVTVALEAGATVLPYPWRDDSAAPSRNGTAPCSRSAAHRRAPAG